MPISNMLIIWVTFLLTACVSAGSTYEIDKVWGDKQNIHILYTKNFVAEVASPLNINGTVFADVDKHYHLKLEKSSLNDGGVVDLARGTLVSGRLIYIDSDFEVKTEFFQSTSAKNIKVNVKNLSGELAIYCDTSVWDQRDVPLRLNDGLVYCGHIIPTHGTSVIDFPDTLQMIIQKHKATQPTALALAGEEFILFLWDDVFTSVTHHYMEYLVIDLTTFELKKSGTRPFEGKAVSGFRSGYFKQGFIVNSLVARLSNQIQVCQIEECKTYNFDSLGISTAFPVVFVDDSGDSITILAKTSDSSTGTLYKVTLLKSEDLKAIEIAH